MHKNMTMGDMRRKEEADTLNDFDHLMMMTMKKKRILMVIYSKMVIEAIRLNSRSVLEITIYRNCHKHVER